MSLQVTEAARNYLQAMIVESSISNPAISLDCQIASFSPDSSVSKAAASGADLATLSVLVETELARGAQTPKRRLVAGLHSSSNVPPEQLVIIEGLRFYLNGLVLQQISNYSLDLVDDELCLRDPGGSIVAL